MHANPGHVHTQQISIIGYVHRERGHLAGKASANFCQTRAILYDAVLCLSCGAR
jgi:hypothetical protein